jgi:hypothetical protein
MLACAAASGRSACRAGSAVSSTALQKRCGARQPASGLRPSGRILKLHSDVLVYPSRGLRPVPGPAIRIDLRIGHLRRAEARLRSPSGSNMNRPKTSTRREWW